MTNRIAAINAYRPRLELGKTIQKAEQVRRLAHASNLNEGSIDMVIKEVRDHIITENLARRPVKIEGLGTWTPSIGLDGSFDVQYRADTGLANGLNNPGAFTGDIKSRENIGKTAEELVALWNKDHPEDLVS